MPGVQLRYIIFRNHIKFGKMFTAVTQCTSISLMLLKLYNADNVKQNSCQLIMTILSHRYQRSQTFSYGVL